MKELSSNGWIKIHRKLQDCWIWQIDKPFDERSAWIDLLMSANHDDVKIPFNGELVLVERGQLITSIRKLSVKWKWNKDKVLKFLRLLESDGMITRNSDKYRTLVTIENYSIYQARKDEEQTPSGTSDGTDNGTEAGTQYGTQDGQQPATNKNDKNDKNKRINKESNTNVLPKKSQSNFVPPTVEEVEAYCNERGNGIDAQTFVDFYESKGWMVGKNKMKVWKAAVRTWENEKKKKMNQQQQTAQPKKIDWDNV